MVPVAWSEVTGRKRPAARSLPLWPPPRPGVSRFRHFRSHLAGVCALQLRPWPAFRPGVRLFRRFRSHLADGAPAAASPWNNWAAWEEHRDAWNNRRPWNIAVRGTSRRVEQSPCVEHRRAHGADFVRTRALGAHGAEFFLVPCAREPLSRTGRISCARDEGEEKSFRECRDGFPAGNPNQSGTT